MIEPSNDWIRTDDRLPEAFEDVLVWFPGGEQHIDVASYDPDEELWALPHHGLTFADSAPLYWMPLPKEPTDV